MTTSEGRGPKIRLRQNRDRTRVYVEKGGRDVSHLVFMPRRLRMGAKGVVRMAAIGGVGTKAEFRRRGLMRQVLARTMEEIGGKGYSCVGLYTSTRIVAHRLYRRFGLVDVARSVQAYKLLDPGRFVCQALSDMLRGLPGGGSPMLVRAELRPHEAVLLRVDESGVRLLTGPPREPHLSLAMSSQTFVALWQGEMTFRYAEEANLVEWRGSESSYRRLTEALARRREAVVED